MAASKFRIFVGAAARSLLWTVASGALGMAPAGIKWVISMWTRNPMMDLEEMLRDGLLIGLNMALVGAVCIDQIFSRTGKIETITEKFLFFVMPVAVLIVSVTAYTILLVTDPKTLDVQHAVNFCKWMLIVSGGYCVVAKFAHFLPSSNSNRQATS